MSTLPQCQQLAIDFANKYGLSSNLVYSLIREESGCKATAGSFAGAKGLMQVTFGTAKQYKCPGVNSPSDLYDPYINVNCGCLILSDLISKLGDAANGLAIAAYNAGIGAVTRPRNKAYPCIPSTPTIFKGKIIDTSSSYALRVLKGAGIPFTGCIAQGNQIPNPTQPSQPSQPSEEKPSQTEGNIIVSEQFRKVLIIAVITILLYTAISKLAS